MTKPASQLTDYLYVDQPRLNAYVEQIRSPLAIEKSSQWALDLSLTGVRVSATQVRHPRPLTTQEKIDSLVHYLNQAGAITERRPGDSTRFSKHVHTPFVLETCEAQRLVLPLKPVNGIEFSNNLELWISPKISGHTGSAADTSGSLILIESAQVADREYCHGYSGYTALGFLLADLRLNDFPSLQASFDDVVGDLTASEQLLATAAALKGTARTVTTLYKLRATVHPEGQSPRSATVVESYGYPIFIAAA